ncbi:uncharacterized protein PF3D7_1120600 [Hydra vulgaris]|uniref:uncharacterized protein PF3D7_1120600 n=1 Tax=Hydra vulgaris TaxID=6087 RepID=UPI001F5EB232|nr:uncharacterized protein PF3D7_1120600 [Hydra vulgaris]
MLLFIILTGFAFFTSCTNVKRTAEPFDKGRNESEKMYQRKRKFEGLQNFLPINKQRHKKIEYPAYILIASKYFESLLNKNSINNERSVILNNTSADKISSNKKTYSESAHYKLSRKNSEDTNQVHNTVDGLVPIKGTKSFNNLFLLNPESSFISNVMQIRDKSIPKYFRFNRISNNSFINPNGIFKNSQILNNKVFNANSKSSDLLFKPGLKGDTMVDQGDLRRQKANREEVASVRTLLENEKVLELKSKQEELEEQQLVEELQLREVRKKILEKKLQKLKLEQLEINNKLQAQKQELLLQRIKEKLTKKKKDMEELSEKEKMLSESLKKLKENKKKPLFAEENASILSSLNKSFTTNENGKNLLSVADTENTNLKGYNSEVKQVSTELHSQYKNNEQNSCLDYNGSNEYCHFDNEEQEELPINPERSADRSLNYSLDATHNELKSQTERFNKSNGYPVVNMLENQNYPDIKPDELNPLDAFLENRNPIDDKSYNLNTQAENVLHSSKSNNLNDFDTNEMSIKKKNPNKIQNIGLKNITEANFTLKEAKLLETLDRNITSKDELLDKMETTSETTNQPKETTNAHETNAEVIILNNENNFTKEKKKFMEAGLDKGAEFIKDSSTQTKVNDKNDQFYLSEDKGSEKELNEKFGKHYGEYPNVVPKKQGTTKNVDLHPIIYRDPIPGLNKGKNKVTELSNEINTSKILKLNETVKSNKTTLLDKVNSTNQSKTKAESVNFPKFVSKLKQTQNQVKLGDKNTEKVKPDELKNLKDNKSKEESKQEILKLNKDNSKIKQNFEKEKLESKLPTKPKNESHILTKVNLDKLKDFSKVEKQGGDKSNKQGDDTSKTNKPILEETKLKKLASATKKPILNKTDNQINKLYNETFNNDKVNTSAEDKSDNIKFSAQVDRDSSNQNSKSKTNKIAESIKNKLSNENILKNNKNITKMSSAKSTSNLNKVLTKNQTNPDKITIEIDQNAEGFAPHPIKIRPDLLYSYSSVTTTKLPKTEINSAAEKKPVTNPSPTNPPTKNPPTTTLKKTSSKPVCQSNECSSYYDFCRTRSTGTYPNEQDCTKYWICVNGVTYPAQCGNGQFYNVSVNQCTPFQTMDVTSIFWTTCDKKRNSVVVE